MQTSFNGIRFVAPVESPARLRARKILSVLTFIGSVTWVLIFADLIVIAFMILGIVVGDPSILHIPFWDMQLRFIISLFI